MVRAAKRGSNSPKGRPSLEKIASNAIEFGINALVENHPRFAQQKDFLKDHIDTTKIGDYLGEALQKIGTYTGEDREKAEEELYNETTSYIVSGELLTDKGKELILRKSLREETRGLFGSRRAKGALEGDKYLNDVMGSFNDLYKLLGSGDYAQRMPELASAVTEIYDMGFWDAALNVLYDNGLMGKGEYYSAKKALITRTKKGVEKTDKAIKQYFPAEALAASILGFLGLGVLLTSNPITGNAIGISTTTNLPAILWGIAVLAAGTGLFLKNKTKKSKIKKPVKKRKNDK